MSRIVHESFDGALVVKTLGRSDHEIDRLRGRGRRSCGPPGSRSAGCGARSSRCCRACRRSAPSLLLALGSWEISVGRITTGDLVQGIALFSILAFPMQVVGFFLEELPRAVVSTRPARPGDGRAARAGARPGRSPRPCPTGALDVEVDDVAFAYEPDQPVLDGVSFQIAPGEVVALVGSTGSGKTTLCELLVRLADPTSGAVRVGGVDLREAEPDSLHRARRARVPGDVPVRRHALGERGARPGRRPTTRCARPCAIAQADRFVGELPDGHGHGRRRAGRHPVGRPAPAGRPGPGAAAPAAAC